MADRGQPAADSAQELEALLQFMYLAPVGLAQTRPDGEVVMLNPRCAQWLMPLAPQGQLDNLFDALSPLVPDLAQRVAVHGAAAGAICEGLQLPVRSGRAGGLPEQVLSLTLIRLDSERLMAVLDDVTEQLRRERALRQSQAWMHSVARGADDYALFALDPAGCIQGWNSSIERLLGNRRHDVVGRPFTALMEVSDPAHRATTLLREADASGWSFDECWMRRSDGTRFWASSLIARLQPPGTSGADTGYRLIVHDISDRRDALEALRRSVSSDHLTGLANRRAFFEDGAAELERCRRQALPVSLLMFDADHFKAINDGHGHAAGDAVLRHIASTLMEGFRDADLVARLGGEEFAVLLPGLAADDAEAAAEQVCARLRAEPARVCGQDIGCTLSAGVADGRPADDGLDDLLLRADAALYAAKACGRDRVRRWQPGLLIDARRVMA